MEINSNRIDLALHLSKHFEYISQEDVYKSKKKHLGASTGDDRSLYISLDERSTSIWWKDNRGFEETIFCGKKIETVEEFKTIKDFLELEIYRIFRDDI